MDDKQAKKEELKDLIRKSVKEGINKEVKEEIKNTVKEFKKLVLQSDEEVKLVFDPYRKKILGTFIRSKEPLTVKQVADKLGDQPAKVHYHVQKFIKAGVLELAKTENINGIIAKYYHSPYNAIMFESNTLSNDVYIAQSKAIQHSVDHAIEKFKQDLNTHWDFVKSKPKGERGQLVSQIRHLYMTPQERNEFVDTINTLLDKYSTPDDDKDVFSALVTMARIQ